MHLFITPLGPVLEGPHRAMVERVILRRGSFAKDGSDNFIRHMRGGGTATPARLNGEGRVAVGGVRAFLLRVWVLGTSFAPSHLAL